jgi:hypothetical protein
MDTSESGIVRLASVGSYLDALSSITSEMTLKERSNLIFLDRCLHEQWGLGRNFILNWCPENDGISLLVIPHYQIAAYANGLNTQFAADHDDLPPSEEFFKALISSKRLLSPRQLDNVARLLRVEKTYMRLREPLSTNDGQLRIVEKMVKRYSISFVPNRAVVLFDIVSFGLLSPFEQVAQINSLSYSMNSAQSKLTSKKIGIDFARSTTGDGFYLWNRSLGLEANLNLFHFMHLVLADNAIARSKSQYNTVPHLRAAFHVGSSYEFHQAEGLNPTLYNYIVGDVTITLARIIEHALPSQILIGEFSSRMSTGPHHSSDAGAIDTICFVDLATASLSQLTGLELSGERIERIKCYLTGMKLDDGNFTVRRITVRDKHGFSRNLFNAKANIYRKHAEPILLGIEDRALGGHQVPESDSHHLLYAG